MLKWVPSEDKRTYMTRGWPFFEQAVSSLIKPTTMLIDVSAEVLQATSWNDIFRRGRVGRKPPLTPCRFSVELGTKSFTNGKTDQDFVAKKYTETFNQVLGNAKALWFSSFSWTDEDAKQFTEVYRFAECLERLVLSDNAFTVVGSEYLIRESVNCPTLNHLDLSDNGIDDSETDALKRVWMSLGRSEDGLSLNTSSRASMHHRSMRTRKPERVHSQDNDPRPTMHGKNEDDAAMSCLRDDLETMTAHALIRKAACVIQEDAMLDSMAVRKEDIIELIMVSQRRSLVDL